MLKIYLGCDLFTNGQKNQAKQIETMLKSLMPQSLDIYNPADNMDINDKEASFASGSQILTADYNRLKESDALIALMDTQDIGLAAEMGIAFELGIPIFQLYTDSRLTGNTVAEKFEQLEKDVFQNDFLYINKLVTGLSYVDKFGKAYEKPLIYKTESDLIMGVMNYYNDNYFKED